MKKSQLLSYDLPDAPGVYFFMGAQKNILYIGKATSLKSRVRSYFASDIQEKRSELIEKMVKEAHEIEWTQTDSALEALILETNLIQSHRPYYNTRSKDDKSYNRLIITNEEWPRVLVVRERDITLDYNASDIKYSFGPYPNGQLFREALKIVRKLFKFYDTRQKVGTEKTKLAKGMIDFNRQIGLYPDAEKVEEYKRTIRHIKLFFQGKKKLVITELEREMKALAKKEAFEEAQQVKYRIDALRHIKDISLLRRDYETVLEEGILRIEAYDVAHLQGDNMVGVMTVVKDGEPVKNDYRKFKIQSVKKSNDTKALKEILERRLKHTEWPLPDIVVVDGSTAQINVAKKAFSAHADKVSIVSVVKDEKHKPVKLLGEDKTVADHKNEILLANAEAHRFAIAYHKSLRKKSFI